MKKIVLCFLIFISCITQAMLAPSVRQISLLAKVPTRSLSSLPPSEIQEHLKKLQHEFPTPVLQRYKNDHDHRHLPPSAIRDELIRYLFLARNEKTQLGMFSKDVDNLWHTFLLFNKNYEQYCSLLDITGKNKSILYHMPHDKEVICPRVCQWSKKQQFIETYKKIFSSEPDKAIWTGLWPCKSSCNPASEPEQSLLSKTDLFNAKPTFIGAAVWYVALMTTFHGLQDGNLIGLLSGLSLGAGRFLYNRIDDRNSPSSCSDGSENNSSNNSPGCGSGSSCGSCGGCD